ncbi:lysozyme inhibitor LprI family protein [Burkholderia ubonensis]|nr:lysozyme inhibitor LprI family protein [Burkholderia ubonensis]
MAAIGGGMILIGILTTIVGVSGFVDTRKVDRRFKTGYKNNEPDTRNFGRAAKRVIYGVGICIVGAAVNNLTDSKTSSPPLPQAQSTSEPNETVASKAGVSPNGVVKLDSNAARSTSNTGDTRASNEGIVIESPLSGNALQPATSESGGATAVDVQPRTYVTSFDCTRASQDDEVAICGDAGLAAMDRRLNQLYEASMKTISDPQALRESESDWLIKRRMCNKDLDCLRYAYGERIGQFLGSIGSKPLIPTRSVTSAG